MKKLFLFLTLLIAGITANAQFTPYNNLNYVKLLKVPPVGAVEDSVLVYDGSDSFVKMRPSSVLIGKATATKTGTVKTDVTEADPVVYTKNTTDELLGLKKDATSTALTSTATLTNNGTTFTLSPLSGVIVDNYTVPATRIVINFAGASNVTPLYFRTLLYIDNTGTLQQMNGMTTDLTPQQRVDNLFIGIVVYSGGTVQVVQLIPDIEYSIGNRFSTLTDFIRNINEGNNIGANGANLQINKGAGYTFRRGSNFATNREVPDVTTDLAATPIPASPNLIGYRNGSGGWTYEPYTGSITPQFWDDGSGVKATVANNKFTNQRVYFFNGTNTYVIYLGRTEHATLETAATVAQSPDAIVDPATSVGSLIGTVSVAYNATALNNTIQARFTQGPRMQGGSGAGGASGSQNMQNTYLNSSVPQITTTALGAVTVQRGSASDTDNILVGKNGVGTTTFSVSGAGNITGGTYNGYVPENLANKATDFTTVNNTLYPSVQAVKTYADGLVVGLLNDRGSYDASTNLYPSTGGSGTSGAILKGNLWAISVAGTLGGVSVGIGDWIRALVDTPAQTAANWSVVEGNFGYVSANDLNVIHTTGDEYKNGQLQVNDLMLTENPPSSQPYSIRQQTSIDDYWKIYGNSDISDRGELVFEVGDNGSSWAGTGQRFRFHYDASSGGIQKDPFIIDYNDITANANLLVSDGMITAETGSLVANGEISRIGFGMKGFINIPSYIKSNFRGANWFNGADMSFYTSSSADITANLAVERMRIASTGELLINTTTNDGVNKLQVNGGILATTYTGGATLTGTPTAPTAAVGSTGTQIANLDFVNTAITNNGIITTSSNITNATLTDTSLPQNGKTLYISNGANNINYTVNAGITASFVKGGTGTITFVQGSGRTMVAANGTLIFNGAQYSTASVVSFGTTDIVYINNF